MIRSGLFGGHLRLSGEVSDSQDQIRHSLVAGGSIDLLQQRGFEERQLLEPHRVVDEDIQFLEPNLIGPRVCGDLVAHDLGPLTAQPQFEQLGL